jgi:HEAT repeat protein
MDFYRPPTTLGTLEALSSVNRAVRTWKFYPQGHPTQRSSLSLAHSLLCELLDGNTLLLVCGRTGFSFPDGEVLKDASGICADLAFEFFIRRVKKITFQHDLFQEDLLELCKILSLSPEVIQQSGGIDTIMAERGIRSIWVNEFDLKKIRSKRQAVEESGIVPSGLDEIPPATDTPASEERFLVTSEEITPEEHLQSLLGRLTACTDDDIYLLLTRQAVTCAEMLQARQETHLLFPLLELLAGHAGKAAPSERIRECAQFAIEQIITVGDVLPFVLERSGEDTEISAQTLKAVLKAGGDSAIFMAIELMASSSNLKTRKTISVVLGTLGEKAVPVLLNAMHDTRWFIVRNICAILGVIASHEALPVLTTCLHHPDQRVQKEAIRSLAQLGGNEAEAAILCLLRENDSSLYRQAMASLGGMKSKQSLPELMNIVFARDLFLQSLPLKIDALAAIGAIGDRQVTPFLVKLLKERFLLVTSRGNLLKAAVAACLGKLGDLRAMPTLEKLSSGSGELGTACTEAIATIQRAEGRADGIS